MAKRLFNAIVFMLDKSQPRKYRKISNLNSFYAFCVSIGADYMNLYDNSTKTFVERRYIKKGT